MVSAPVLSLCALGTLVMYKFLLSRLHCFFSLCTKSLDAVQYHSYLYLIRVLVEIEEKFLNV